MIRLAIKLKGDKQRYTQSEFLEDEFVVSKKNPKLLALVQDAIDKCKIDAIEVVEVVARLEM